MLPEDIRPLWHKKVNDIDLNLQPDQLREDYLKKGFHIYKSSWADLFTVLTNYWSNLYKNNNLWTESQEPEKIKKILSHWKNKIPLIPPMLIDNGNGKLVPSDGKHRLKVASILDSTEITFIIFEIDLPRIGLYFNPILID